MDYGELPILGNCHTYFARHCFVWGQGSSRYLRSIHGHRGILWAAGWDYRQGYLQVNPELSAGIIGPSMILPSQGVRAFRNVCGMPAGRTMHHTWDVRVSRRCCRSQVTAELTHQFLTLNNT